MKKEIKYNVYYGTEDFKKLFDNLIENKIKDVTKNIKNARYHEIDKCYSSHKKR